MNTKIKQFPKRIWSGNFISWGGNPPLYKAEDLPSETEIISEFIGYDKTNSNDEMRYFWWD